MQALPGGHSPNLQRPFAHRKYGAEAQNTTPQPGPKHRKGGKLRYKNSEVLGRVFWDADHSSPWVVFKNITHFRTWSKEMRQARPGVKTEFMYFGWHSPASLLSSAKAK